jgi:hypothetical protein
MRWGGGKQYTHAIDELLPIIKNVRILDHLKDDCAAAALEHGWYQELYVFDKTEIDGEIYHQTNQAGSYSPYLKLHVERENSKGADIGYCAFFNVTQTLERLAYFTGITCVCCKRHYKRGEDECESKAEEKKVEDARFMLRFLSVRNQEYANFRADEAPTCVKCSKEAYRFFNRKKMLQSGATREEQAVLWLSEMLTKQTNDNETKGIL